MSVEFLTERISPYFTGDVLNNILKKTSGLNDIKIDKIVLGSEMKKGDSYLSTITKFTVDATGTDKEGQRKSFFLPVIVKSIPKNVARRKTYRSTDFFETEIIFYEKVWPEMQKFKKSKNLLDDEVPPLLSSFSDGINDYVALEDLSYKNYRCLLREDGFTYDITVMLLKLMANFHAITIAYRHQNPEFAKVALLLKETYFAERFRKWYSNFQENTLYKLFRNAVQKKLPSTYLDKMNNLFNTDYFGTLCRFCEIHNSPFSTVTQGDTWLPNFLFKFDGKTPVSSMLIDFQLARYTTLTNDLIFFLYACVPQDILLTKWDQLIEEYHAALSSRIQALGSPADLITLDALKQDIQKNGLFGVGMGMEAVTMASLEQDEVADLDLIQGEDAVPIETVWVIPLFKDDARNDRLAFLIKHAVDKGFIP